MKDVDRLQKLPQIFLRCSEWHCPLAIVELCREDFVAELEDAVDLLLPQVLLFDDVQQANEGVIVDELAQKRNFSHSRVIYTVRYILQKIKELMCIVMAQRCITYLE